MPGFRLVSASLSFDGSADSASPERAEGAEAGPSDRSREPCERFHRLPQFCGRGQEVGLRIASNGEGNANTDAVLARSLEAARAMLCVEGSAADLRSPAIGRGKIARY